MDYVINRLKMCIACGSIWFDEYIVSQFVLLFNNNTPKPVVHFQYRINITRKMFHMDQSRCATHLIQMHNEPCNISAFSLFHIISPG